MTSASPMRRAEPKRSLNIQARVVVEASCRRLHTCTLSRQGSAPGFDNTCSSHQGDADK